jgi:outer membrane protein insertion porin family
MRIIFAVLFLLISIQAYAATVDRVEVSGNRRVPAVRIQNYLLQAGEEFSPERINQSIKNLHSTGYFSEISIDAEVVGNEFVLTYILREMPIVSAIEFTGYEKQTADSLLEVVPFRVGDTLNLVRIGEALRAMRNLYEKDAFYNVKIDYKVLYRNEMTASLLFNIEEGKKSKAYNIWFYGNKAISNNELKEAMHTKEKTFWSVFSKSGTLIREITEFDRELITDYYRSKGYLDVEVGEAEILFQEDPSKLNYIVRISEGLPYTLKSLSMKDNADIYTEDELKKYSRLVPGDYFNLKYYRDDIKYITEEYMKLGYAQANVEPSFELDNQTREVSVSYTVDPGSIFHINRIIFEGNVKSRDNVLRREFDIAEGDQYDYKLIKEAEGNLFRTGYYSVATITDRYLGGDMADLVVKVEEEKSTEVIFGVMFTTDDNEFAASLQFVEKNLFGRGLEASFNGELSTRRSDYTVRLSNPWIMDRPYSYSLEVYQVMDEYDEYTRKATGGSLTFGHQPIKRRVFLNYGLSHEQIEIEDIHPNASNYIKRQEGKVTVNAVLASIMYSYLDNNIDPSKGLKTSLSMKYAADFLGSERDFVRAIADATYYHPMPNRFTGMIHVRAGHLWRTAENELPIDERFLLGGMYSVRGFEYREISPLDSDGDIYGGDKMYYANFELVRPIMEENMTIRAVLFFDLGQAMEENESFFTSPRMSVGAGLRFLTSMGLIRLEYGHKLDRKEGEDAGAWEFAIGSSF